MRQYLNLVERVLSKGTCKKNRTGVDTIATFAEFFKVNLGAPIMIQLDFSKM